MIHEVVPIIMGELNQFFQVRFGTNEDKVVLSNIVTQEGKIAIQGENKIIVTLLNIERDGSNQAFGNGFVKTNPPVHINLYILISAYFETSNYVEALKFLSGVIGFFQSHNSFDHQNTPHFPVEAGKIKMEIVNIDFKELSNMWASIGAKYLPSVIYKLRTLDMNEDNIQDEIPAISGITIA